MSLLGEILWHQGRYVEAEEILSHTVEKRNKILGEEYEDTLISAYWLGNTLLQRGRHSKAAEILSHTLQGYKKVYGENTMETIDVLNLYSTALGSSARALCDEGRYHEAEEIFSRTLEARAKVLGDEDASRDVFTWDLGQVLLDQKKYFDAERMFWQTFRNRCKTLGNEHPATLDALEELVWTQRRQQEDDLEDSVTETQSDDENESWEVDSVWSFASSSRAATI